MINRSVCASAGLTAMVADNGLGKEYAVIRVMVEDRHGLSYAEVRGPEEAKRLADFLISTANELWPTKQNEVATGEA